MTIPGELSAAAVVEHSTSRESQSVINSAQIRSNRFEIFTTFSTWSVPTQRVKISTRPNDLRNRIRTHKLNDRVLTDWEAP